MTEQSGNPAGKKRQSAREWAELYSTWRDHRPSHHDYPAKRKPRVRLPGAVALVPAHLPANFDLDAYPTSHRDGVAYAIDLIRKKWMLRQMNEEGFVQLKAAYNRKWCDWPRVKKLLVDRKDIRTDGSFQRQTRRQKGKCEGYQLAEQYQHQHTVRILLGPEISRRVRALYVEEERIRPSVCQSLATWQQQLKIDPDRASAIIPTLHPPASPDGNPPESIAQYQARLREIVERLHYGDSWDVFDRVGRYHTPLSNLHRALRCCLYAEIDGKRHNLSSLDLRNSQPLFAGLLCLLYWQGSEQVRQRLCKQTFVEENPHVYRAMNERLRQYAATTNPRQAPTPAGNTNPTPTTGNRTSNQPGTNKRNHIPCLGSPNSRTRKDLRETNLNEVGNCDLGEFWQLYMVPALMGSVYEALMTPRQQAKHRRELVQGVTGTRDRCKVATLVTLYDCWGCRACGRKMHSLQRRWPNRLRHRLQKWVPPLYQMLRELKADNHAQAALLMQNLEATMFIQRICGRLVTDHPAIPLWPLHDSLFSLPEYLPVLRTIITEEFASLGLCLAPTALKEEHHP